ncbi:cell division protein FtsX [Calothrix sp. PCC 6303]|uniref:cell division protein FtsX n=1 Tax=Calothrix sp. PCC 6303 TaxID=1170562 RepID=UPI0002A042FD|nr:ABC transporter permease [Calothrix sp. PCC 6303]AFZ04041.1 cell division protein FtsX [Calothrix sp. PCC 6303]
MLRIFTKLDYLLRETFLGLQRGGWMNWAAISIVTVLLFLFGLSVQTSWQMEKLLNQFGSQLEVSVYLEPNVQVNTVEPMVIQLPGVTNVEKVTKEQAWTKLVKELGMSDIQGATQQLGSNPLVDELRVKAQNPDVVPRLAMQLAKIKGVESVQYIDEAVKRIGQLHRGLNWATIIIIGILTLTAVAVTSITIRLIVMARRREIEVMQLVGATASWIYLPFIFQGIAFGFVGSAIAWCFISLSQQFLRKLLANQPDFIKFLSTSLQLSTSQTFLLPFILLCFGTAVGLVGSLFAVRKFAKT